jgi:uncharacterized protein YceH (UPF0502 family)
LDYNAHRLVIVNALTKEPHYENPFNDWELGLVGRLISRGDKTLLSVVFNAAAWSDGAMTEDISDIIEQELISDPGSFVDQLGRLPRDSRKNVYGLIDGQTLQAAGIAKVKNYLGSRQSKHNNDEIVRELLHRLSEVELKLKSS